MADTRNLESAYRRDWFAKNPQGTEEQYMAWRQRGGGSNPFKMKAPEWAGNFLDAVGPAVPVVAGGLMAGGLLSAGTAGAGTAAAGGAGAAAGAGAAGTGGMTGGQALLASLGLQGAGQYIRGKANPGEKSRPMPEAEYRTVRVRLPSGGVMEVPVMSKRTEYLAKADYAKGRDPGKRNDELDFLGGLLQGGGAALPFMGGKSTPPPKAYDPYQITGELPYDWE